MAPENRKRMILIMDDEEIVGDIAKQMLDFLGYDVALVQEGQEAVDLYKTRMQSEERFHLVIMDLTIPGGMGGKEAVGEILALDPEAKVVVSSGYTNDPIMANCRKYGFSGAIAKPFDMESLKKIVEELT